MNPCFLLGLLLVLGFSIQMLLKGASAFTIIHDQLDGEVTTYILRARHIGQHMVPEFMGGVPKSALVPASYGTLFFYILFHPATAFNLNYAFVQLTAFIGLYLLLTRCNIHRWVAAVVALFFSFLPFYSVYGLSVMGQPLLWYAMMLLWEKRSLKAYGIVLLFATFSSPFLVGFADCGLAAVMVIVAAAKHRAEGKLGGRRTLSFVYMLLLMLGVYVFLYRDVFQDILSSGMVSHRIEWVLSEEKQVWQSIKGLWQEGMYNSVSNHRELIGWVLPVMFAGMAFFPLVSRREKNLVTGLAALMLTAFLIAVFYGVFHSHAGVQLRGRLGGTLKSFQFDRIYWLYPGIWYWALGLTVELMLLRYEQTPGAISDNAADGGGWRVHMSQSRGRGITKAISVALTATLLVTTGIRIWNESVAKKNLGAETQSCFGQFYSPRLFRKIADSIKQSTGKGQSEYRVASIALFPSIPLYNGFYCVDGYSNNYPLEYKHRFRKVIEKELEKNEDIRWYFDEWGNRCYLFSAELGRSYTFEKGSPAKIQNLNLNTDALRALDCSYVFSSVEIINCEGLVLEKTFSNDESPYKIWIYRVGRDPSSGNEKA